MVKQHKNHHVTPTVVESLGLGNKTIGQISKIDGFVF